MRTTNVLSKKKIIVATHIYTTGPAQDLERYLVNNTVSKLLFIGHPLFYRKNQNGSGYKIYKKGKLKKQCYFKNREFPAIFSYLKHFLLNIYWIVKSKEIWDLFVGADNLNAFCGILLKRLGLVRKVVFYVIDYAPQRFENNFLNYIYHRIDKYCVRNCDETWNLSPRMAEGREKYKCLKRESYNKQRVVPVGVWYNRIPRKDFSEIEKHILVFMGHILEKQGVQYVLDAVLEIVKQIPDFKFLIIGEGEYLGTLKQKVKDLGIEKYVNFAGFIKSHQKVEKILSKCAISIAMYQQGNLKSNFTYFADPAKLKSYLAAGLPVLLTNVSYNAKEIEENKCGIIIDYNKNEIAKAVIDLMKDEKRLKEYRQNAINYARQFDWNLIFSQNLKRIL